MILELNLDDPTFAPLLVAAGLLLVALVYARVYRVKKWKRILAEPASSFLLKSPRWLKQLPPGVRLNSEGPLFEALYECLMAEPQGFASSALARSAAFLEKNENHSPGSLDPVERISEEEKIKSLMGAKVAPESKAGLPVDTLAENLVVNFVHILQGKKKFKVGVEHALLDSLSAGGGIAGAKLGGISGLALAPLVTGHAAMALPALLILGAWLGALIGKKLGSRVKARHKISAFKKLRNISIEFKKAFINHFPALRSELDQRFRDQLIFMARLSRARQGILLRLIFPSMMTVFFGLSRKRLKMEWQQERADLKKMGRKLKAMPPLEFAQTLRDLGSPEMGEEHVEIALLRQELDAAFKELEAAENQAA
jgi:hypothetical protein